MASSVAREAPPTGPTGSQPASLAPDAQRRYPESQPSHPGEASYYAAQVASERSAANAHAVFRTLQAKFPNQLGGRDPIVSRTDLGTEGIYYRALVGPFASMEEATGVCSTLKAAGDNCLVERD
jgi:hypothetical protein